MQRETSNDSFLEYGQTYHEPIRLTHPDLIHQHQTAITRRYVSQFYCFNCDTYMRYMTASVFCWSPIRQMPQMYKSLP